MGVLGELEVAEEEFALRDAVVAEEDEVHVGDGLSGVEIATDHLDDGLEIEIVAGDCELGAEEQNAHTR